MSETKTIVMQAHLKAKAPEIYRALTTSAGLQAWLADCADIDLAAGRLRFWGAATPFNPNRQSKQQTLLAHERDRLLQFAWPLGDVPSQVTFRLRELEAGRSALTLLHQHPQAQPVEAFTLEDYWFVHLENLRRYIDGKSCEARVDFSQPMTGDIQHALASSASPERVFSVLTRPQLMERWIANQARIELQPGGKYDLGWGIEGIRVLEYELNQRLSVSWQMGEEAPTRATWRLEPLAGQTRIRFEHSGFAPDFPNNGIWIGWLNYLNWLRSVAEYGETWQPPVIPLDGHPWAQIYPKSMHEAQDKLVQSDLQLHA